MQPEQAAGASIETGRVTPFPGGLAQSDTFDPLLGCLEIAADHYGRSAASGVLTSGLPLIDGRLTTQLFPRAAARVGLSARVVKRRIADLQSILFPVILLLKDDTAVVLVQHDGETATVALPDTGRGAVHLPLKALEEKYAGYAILIKPEYRAYDERQDVAAVSTHWFWGCLLYTSPSPRDRS